MENLREQIDVIRSELKELEAHLPHWDNDAYSKAGAGRYKLMAKRIVESAKRLESLVKENTFPNR